MATKCWFCEHVADCKKYQCGGCEKFSRFEYSIRGMAKLLNVSKKQVSNWLSFGDSCVTTRIKKITGIDFEVCRENARRILFRKIRNGAKI